MKSIGALRDLLGSVPVERDGVSWMVSCAVHLSLLVLVATFWQALPEREGAAVVLSSADAASQTSDLQEVQYSEEGSAEEVGAASFSGMSAAMTSAPSIGEVMQVETRNMGASDVTAGDLPVMIELSSAPNLNDQVSIRGDAGVGVATASAVEKLTYEILQSLETRPTLVVWLMDQSGSLREQRSSIERQFDKIYEELHVLESQQREQFTKHGAHPLLTAVVAFGQEVSFRMKNPSDDLDEIKKAIHDIPLDESGVELTFTAVIQAAQKYQRFRSSSPARNVMFVVVTDEAGNDQNLSDDATNICARHAIPVYVIGVPAPFGQRQAFVRYVDPDPKYAPQDLPVDQGPESVAPENVQIGFSGASGDRHVAIDSGFGPYALTRLCSKTSGIYFAVHPNRPAAAGHVKDTAAMATRISEFFDRDVMRSYAPDYVSSKQYEQIVKENRARLALVTAADMAMVDPMERPRTRFPKTDEAALKRELDGAQQAAALVKPKLQKLYDVLKQGEADRAKLSGTRWQAGYDLAMGRVLANLVRADSYNSMLAKPKNGLKFEKPDSDTWVIKPSNEVTTGSAQEKLAKQARDYLERVRDQHRGTPWAYLAERELSEPLGWEWTEQHTGVNDARRMGGGGGAGGPPQDKLRQLQKPKETRQNVKL